MTRLAAEYPGTATELCALRHSSAYELLVATILSAQTTDERVNSVTPALFARYPRPADLAEANPEDVEKLIFQQYEIGLMEGYLQRWGKPRVADRETVMGWMGHPTPPAQMPGLATDAQLEAYEAAQGRDVDAGFLRLMTPHHEGGVHMAEAAVSRVADEAVRDLAARMARNQRTEIVEYRRTAERLGITL